MEDVMFSHTRLRAVLSAGVLAACVAGWPASPSAQQSETPLTIFRTSRDLVSIDVVVRDRSGAPVRGLTAADFEVREDGRPQEILTVSFQEVDSAARPVEQATLLHRLGRAPAQADDAPANPPEIGGRRLILMLFDLSAMEPDEVQRGVQAALTFVDTQMTGADLVAVASLTWQLTVLTDFTGERETLREVLDGMVSVDLSTGAGTDVAPGDDAVLPTGGITTAVAATDARLRAIRLLADALAPVPQKKALLYFTAGLANAAQDTPAELRAATSAAARAYLAIYPVDTRGLRTVIPSGAASTPSRAGEGLFSGRDVNDQFTELTASQDTMAAMASSTGGRMFSGVNDLSGAFERVRRDTSAYYLLGYSSANDERDGRFRRVQVRVRRDGVRIEARAGYYGELDFARTGRAERETQLEERLAAPPDTSRLLLDVSTAWFRSGRPDRYRVPIALTLPAPASRSPRSNDELDILATLEDEQGRVLARLRDTQRWNSDEGPRSLVYETSVMLPPGSFTLKAVARENTNGDTGSVRTTVHVPDVSSESLAVSAPTVRRSRTGSSVLYVEVYDSRRSSTGRAAFVTTVTLFRGDTRVFEGDLSSSMPGEAAHPDTRAFELALQPGTPSPGRYLCQITVVDADSGRFAVMRTALDLP